MSEDTESMRWLSLQRAPMLWDLFQLTVGGTADKQRLCVRHFNGAGRVLEIGCATGNIARAFRKWPQVAYTGLDIEAGAIARARRVFAGTDRFEFVCQDLESFSRSAGPFDYVLLAGVAHHLTDDDLDAMLVASRRLMAPGAKLVVVDPVQPDASDSWLVRNYLRVERGMSVRRAEALLDRLSHVDGLRVIATESDLVGATPWSVPLCARFLVCVLVTDGARPKGDRGN
jgi:SAM-dependent methyltransferase